VRKLAVFLPLLLLAPLTHAGDLATVSKSDCDAALSAEITRLEDSFSRTRNAWESTVARRFQDHERELTAPQMQAARTLFDQLVVGHSNSHVKAVALPGVYRTMLTIPQYDLSVCEKPGEMRTLGNQAIADFLQRLAELLPLVEKSVDATKTPH